MIVDPVIGRAAVRLTLSPARRERLALLAAGRPLVIDYYRSRLRVRHAAISLARPDEWIDVLDRHPSHRR